MHILLCSSYPHHPETRGGLQSTTDELCLALMEKGVGVTVLCGRMDTTDEAGISYDRSLGYLVVRASAPASALPLVAGLLDPAVIVVQSSHRLADLLAVALETHIPTAVYLHNVEGHRVGGVLPNHPDILYFANSSFTAARWLALFGIGCHVLPPVVLPHRYQAPSSGDRVLFVNPVPEKGLERLETLARANPDVPFLAVESWTAGASWRGWLEQRFCRCPNVEWRPAAADMSRVYAEARFVLMPSVWEEAYGRTVIEAQINGLPVLASNRGALPATVGGGGIVLDLEAPPEQWSLALRRLYFDITVWQATSDAARDNARTVTLDTMRALDDALMHLGLHALGRKSGSPSAGAGASFPL
ncbi:glycosyltransferase [Magnetospirillum molischianum]|uniref:Glycosyl transferase, group 1 n=1 Tax=Magnetospirillum molischianum DSM 120 TaxID=1150626 RepID=H8FS25_MAGML|nr:glycosyltransferase [Magnetospirillum molischianum]CCG41163.1 Glycosyl transferase, group 1 [Magnetospirillum molischianum DSM 120]